MKLSALSILAFVSVLELGAGQPTIHSNASLRKTSNCPYPYNCPSSQPQCSALYDCTLSLTAFAYGDQTIVTSTMSNSTCVNYADKIIWYGPNGMELTEFRGQTGIAVASSMHGSIKMHVIMQCCQNGCTSEFGQDAWIDI